MELQKSLIFSKHNPDIYLGFIFNILYKFVDIYLRFGIIQPLTKQKRKLHYVNPLSHRIRTRRWHY